MYEDYFNNNKIKNNNKSLDIIFFLINLLVFYENNINFVL